MVVPRLAGHFPRMSRRKRSHLPGTVFHLTSRTHRKELLFLNDALRDDIVDIIDKSLTRSDASLIAFTIMPNHLHVVVRQGDAPLSQLMHPLCRGVARASQRRLKLKGHIFGDRFHDKECSGADHLREIVVYTHRNPVRARLCELPADWKWSSRPFYVGETMLKPRIDGALGLFAVSPDDDRAALYAGYLRYEEWRRACDCLAEGELRPPQPLYPAGDQYYARHFTTTPLVERPPRPDLCDIAWKAINELAPGLSLQDVVHYHGSRQIAALRKVIIERALRAGHRNRPVARYMHASDTLVSRVRARLRSSVVIHHDRIHMGY